MTWTSTHCWVCTQAMRVVCLGAGQDVGRSCVVVTLGGRNIMFDCGMHMGFNDARRFPDFSYLASTGSMDSTIDCVLISHFHLDHCGALPHFTEICNYNGPLFMSAPTRAICPILLEDFRRIVVDRRGESDFFTSEDIQKCMRKVRTIKLRETIVVDGEIEITAYYAGHVLGACMFHVQCAGESILYTGDYNMTPDRHLGAASVDALRPDLLITESTYGTTVRDSKRTRETEFLSNVHDCVLQGGKVLIPVFALGRAQELCILIETYWDRMGLSVPVFFSAGLVERANLYYQLYIQWTNQKIKTTFTERNMFDFKHIKAFDRKLIDAPGPCVLFATPGMLHAGLSLEIFKAWCHDPKNLVIIPGYCVAGTVGNKVLSGAERVEIDRYTTVTVKCRVENMSFSAHTDAKGIVTLIRQLQPANVMLVHGERARMCHLQSRIERELGVPVVFPPNGTPIELGEDASDSRITSIVSSDPACGGTTTLKAPARSGTTVEIDPVLADYLREQTNQCPLYRPQQDHFRRTGVAPSSSTAASSSSGAIVMDTEEGELAEENEEQTVQQLRANCQGAVSWGTSSGSFAPVDGLLILQESKIPKLLSRATAERELGISFQKIKHSTCHQFSSAVQARRAMAHICEALLGEPAVVTGNVDAPLSVDGRRDSLQVGPVSLTRSSDRIIVSWPRQFQDLGASLLGHLRAAVTTVTGDDEE